MNRSNWTHNELSMAFNLYCRIPFGQYHNRNPSVIELAFLIGRTPSAVAMKLCNFASLDPIHQTRGVKGLANASAADKEIWVKFNTNWEHAVMESSTLFALLQERNPITGIEPTIPEGATDVERTIRQRRGQDFFRQAILAAYGARCCITGTPLPELLIASHILPWSKFPQERLNPRNGLCLSSIFDSAFDRGLITFDDQYQLVLSNTLRKTATTVRWLQIAFKDLEGQTITLPHKFLPDQTFLQVHRDTIFLT